MMKWFVIPFTSGPHFVRTLHHDPSILGGPTWDGSDHELLIAKFRLKLKKVGKTTRSFRYDLNQIPYDHTVEVRNRFKGLDLIERLMNYGQRFMTLYRRQGARPSQRKRNAKKVK